MTRKLLLAFALAGLSAASAKTYDVNLAVPSQVGTSRLQPGEYKLKVEGSKATLTNDLSGKRIETNVKVENSDRKFSQTEIRSTKSGDVNRVDEIRLGGTRMIIEFN